MAAVDVAVGAPEPQEEEKAAVALANKAKATALAMLMENKLFTTRLKKSSNSTRVCRKAVPRNLFSLPR